ncbi:MAG: hypothetical protein HY823_05565 [Acidobacteria bacterium]|nr:hypothetical protein [Acidobacteriota bacterium]
MPSWNHLHPAVVHFPIALGVAVPLLALLALLWPGQRRGLLAGSLLVLALALGAALLALATGQAAEPFARRTPELRAALLSHESRAQLATVLLAFLGLALGALLGIPSLLRRSLPEPVLRGMLILWIAFSLGTAGALLLAGKEGGRMVHELHTHAS